MKPILLIATVVAMGTSAAVAQSQVKKSTVEGITNFAQVETTVACAGAVTPAAVAGINFVHLPLNGAMPDPAVADRFLEVITKPGYQPAFIHCASGNRASAMWLIKRVLIDKWDNDRALEEASQLGSMSPVMKTFALDYIQAHKK